MVWKWVDEWKRWHWVDGWMSLGGWVHVDERISG